MLVSRAKAEEAAKVLDLILSDDEGYALTESDITTEYRRCVKAAHPDKGGTPEAFARVDWAKHVLLAWLAKPKPQAEAAHKGDPCPNCGGSGKIRVQNGFKAALTRQCGKCYGIGEITDVDRGGGDL